MKGQLADLVQEERPSLGLLEEPRFVPYSAGERAPHVAEELGLEQRIGDRRAVDGDEGSGRAGTGAVDGPRNHFLAGSALPGDQDGGAMRRHPRHDVERGPQCWTFRHHGAGIRSGVEPGGEARHVSPQSLPLFGLPEGEDDFIGTEWLGEIVVRALLHGGNRGVLAAIGAHHDDQPGAPPFLVGAEEPQPVELGHPHITEDQIERFGQGPFQPCPAVALRHHFVPGAREEQAEGLPETRFIVHDQDPGHGRTSGRTP